MTSHFSRVLHLRFRVYTNQANRTIRKLCARSNTDRVRLVDFLPYFTVVFLQDATSVIFGESPFSPFPFYSLLLTMPIPCCIQEDKWSNRLLGQPPYSSIVSGTNASNPRSEISVMCDTAWCICSLCKQTHQLQRHYQSPTTASAATGQHLEPLLPWILKCTLF